MSIATFRKFQMKKAETLSKKTLFSKFLRVPFLQNTPPPPPPPPPPSLPLPPATDASVYNIHIDMYENQNP